MRVLYVQLSVDLRPLESRASDLFWQRATPVVVVWFADSTCKNSH